MTPRSDVEARPSSERIAEYVSGAQKVLVDPLPAGHKLWKSWALDLADNVLALARLSERVEEQAERLRRYETPGEINSVQKVMEERRRAEAAEAERDRLWGALREIAGMQIGASQAVLVARRALAPPDTAEGRAKLSEERTA